MAVLIFIMGALQFFLLYVKTGGRIVATRFVSVSGSMISTRRC
jgi:hypothetical protein